MHSDPCFSLVFRDPCFSFRLNDEASLNVYDRDFAARMTAVFEQDLKHAKRYDHAMWERRPLSEKLAEKVVRPIRPQL